MIAGRRSKTVAFVATLALTTFGALTTASHSSLPDLWLKTHTADCAQADSSACYALAAMLVATPAFTYSIAKGGMAYYRARFAWLKATGKDFQDHYARENGTAAIALRHVANLAIAARKGIKPAPSLAHEAFEVAQWANKSSAAAAIQQMSGLAPIQRLLGDYAGPRIDRSRKGDAKTRADPSLRAGRQKLVAFGPWARPGEADFNAADAALAYAEPLTAKEMQTLLGANEALVFFLVGANESYVFALTREGFEWRTISLGEENVSAKVAASRRGLYQPSQ